MAGFWYPYADFGEAQRRLCGFADRTVGPACGVSFCDGRSITVLRRPRGGTTDGAWMNVLTRHIAAPPPPPQPHGIAQRLERWFENALTAYGEAEIKRSQAELAASRAEYQFLHDEVWLPTHQFLLRHKWVADGVAVAADVVGVVALVGLVIVAPELVAAGTLLSIGALATGSVAGAASVVLLVYDGTVFVSEVSGHEAFSKRVEDDKTIQRVRIAATLLLLPDLPVGGTRALLELRAAGSEAREGLAAAGRLDESAEAQRARAASVRNPAKHPRPIQKHLHRAKVLAKAADEKREEVGRLQSTMRTIKWKDMTAVPAATGVSEGLLVTMPPNILMSDADVASDGQMLSKIAGPEHGMPRDVRIEITMSGSKHVEKQ